MALGLGEAGEQNAPLGRAVIGGLTIATFATLFLVPIFYVLLRRKLPALHTLDRRFAAEAAGASTGGSVHSNRELPNPEVANQELLPAQAPVITSTVRRTARFYLFARSQSSRPGRRSPYFHSARDRDIATVREGEGDVADLGPRVEVVTVAAGPEERVIKAARRRTLRRLDLALRQGVGYYEDDACRQGRQGRSRSNRC